ncbi:hypothetical protein SORBI_3005G205200 [Sorghum bicolor]|uniref:Uncharacterized protein n=1 Tax=Sorghum bicolor TaxID=4558 RepID=A0A1Z5RJX0_SORBI|nr:hypothetical protein SORBI_3005G205200 [Sorghum bicolor]
MPGLTATATAPSATGALRPPSSSSSSTSTSSALSSSSSSFSSILFLSLSPLPSRCGGRSRSCGRPEAARQRLRCSLPPPRVLSLSLSPRPWLHLRRGNPRCHGGLGSSHGDTRHALPCHVWLRWIRRQCLAQTGHAGCNHCPCPPPTSHLSMPKRINALWQLIQMHRVDYATWIWTVMLRKGE